MATRGKVITCALSETLNREINKWLCEPSNLDYITTLYIPTSLLELIAHENSNRSKFIRECSHTFLDFLSTLYKEPIPYFTSRCSFIRHALVHHYVYCNTSKVEDERYTVDEYLKENGKYIIGEA